MALTRRRWRTTALNSCCTDHVSAGAKIDFFEEMVELAWRSGALAPERLALRDGQTSPTSRERS
ncbi:hypothetical protein WCE37_05475 [Luteimonas sp. MJ250]|uniref:hypothetical protein n=1 Tax=Luteimonas sp. MJ250 TaxID=3129236 RepID=UPI0031BBAFA1